MAKKQPVKITKPSDSDDHLGQEIQIKCEGSDLIELDSLTNFQGKLKSLSESAYKRLKHSILTLGFSFPVAAWKYRNKTFILDAHQRVLALKRMRDEGYVIPKLPVVYIEAKDQQEAARKVLAATSQYGEVEYTGLKSFADEFKLELPEIEESFKFPEINFDTLKLNYFNNEQPSVIIGEDVNPEDFAKKVKVSAHERKVNDYSGEDVEEKGLEVDFREVCPHCGGKL